MNKLMIFGLIVLAVMNMTYAVSATENNPGIESINKECQGFGYDFGVVRYEWNGSNYIKAEENYPLFNTTVTGNSSDVSYKSKYKINGIITKEGKELYFHTAGFFNSNITKTSKHDISHVTFCGNGIKVTTPPTDPNPVPEFSFATLAIAVVICGLGIAGLRKQ